MITFFKKYNRPILHIGFWCFFYFLLTFDVLEATLKRETLVKMTIMAQIVFSFAIVTYINFYILMPRWLYPKRYVYYTLAVCTLIVFACFLNDITLHYFFQTQYMTLDRVLTLVPFQCFVMGIKAFRMDIDKNRRISELERIQTQKELELLKSQINPHFLFNTLNNLYALTLTDGKMASEVVLKLSELMRYMLTTAQEPSVLLQSEVDYLTHYINLEHIRLNADAVVQFNKSGDFSRKNIAPMLFLPFVENAFKHGVEMQSKNILLDMDIALQDDDLFFQIKNSKPKYNNAEKIGTGLDNIKKRLQLLYPQKHELNITEDDHLYAVKLWIKV